MAETTGALSGAAWRKSSHSSGNGGECLQVADCLADIVPVRDSEDPHGPTLTIPAAAWTAFVTGLKTGGPLSGKGPHHD